jgi:hypothetical protein
MRLKRPTPKPRMLEAVVNSRYPSLMSGSTICNFSLPSSTLLFLSPESLHGLYFPPIYDSIF